MENNFVEAIPANVRKTIYLVYGFLGVAIGAIQVGYSSAGYEPPVWLIVTLAVYAFLGTAFGFTAFTNTPKASAQVPTGTSTPLADTAPSAEPGTEEAETYTGSHVANGEPELVYGSDGLGSPVTSSEDTNVPTVVVGTRTTPV
ncbi:hypothetical protein [Kocuria sp. HSID16901]|uniref:hypothetical protein n=1 Tax=Kocuria sp. HSID16901 TaxID=2419505 RepID=UPI000660AD14|nr:hypothetical protein [Kocuria sp. HSID16901]RUQ23524.1 hypothetical protein D8M21_02140 [Kocuria sp. HSID16901]